MSVLLSALVSLARPVAERERDLGSRIAAGDEEALRQVYDLLAGRVRAVALRVLRSSSEADDVVQETFVDVWRSAARFDPAMGSLATWVTTIGHHRAIDRLRRTALAARSANQADLGETSPRTGLEDVEARETRALIRQALDGLPNEQRQAIELMYFDGLSQREVAEKLGAPLGTIKGRVRAAMAKLSALLDSLAPAVRA